MLQALSDNKWVRFKENFTALHAAAWFGSLPLTQVLIKQAIAEGPKQSDPDLESVFDGVDDFGNTPFLYAIKQRHHQVSELLLKTEAVDPTIKDNTLLRWVIDSGNHALLRSMLRYPKINVRIGGLLTLTVSHNDLEA